MYLSPLSAFLKSLRHTRWSIAFRLAVWYSILFPLSSVLAFGMAYFLLTSYANQKDVKIIQAKLDEYASLYQTGGSAALRKEIESENKVDGKDRFFVHIVGPGGDTLFLGAPQAGVTYGNGTNERWADKEIAGGGHGLEMRSARLQDGSLLYVGKSTQNRRELLRHFRYIFAGVMIPLILIGVAGGAFFAFRALRPMRNLIDTVRSIELGTIHARIPVSGKNDEFAEMAFLFNRMLAKIEALINGMRDSLDNVAHDLRTPLTRLRIIAEAALEAEAESDVLREALMDCAEESERILTMINTLMDISEAETGVMRLNVEEVNVSALLHDVADLYTYVAEDGGVSVLVECPDGISLWGDTNRMRAVLANLLDNAIKYTPRGGNVDLKADCSGEEVVIIVKDDGEGIPHDEIPRIWERLYRVDKSRSRRGLGLGLSLVKAIVHAHGGYIKASSMLGKGSLFILHLPANACPLPPHLLKPFKKVIFKKSSRNVPDVDLRRPQ
ncbi:MAG: ATP-binding protein [Syntrophobacteraceae bacterium]